MGGKRKGGNRSNYKGNKRPRPTDANGWNDTEKLSLQDFKNSRFDAYYQAQKIVPEGQWEEFLAALRRHLPISFRLSAISGCDTRLLKELKGNCFGMAPGFEMKMTDEDGIEHVARRPEPLPFYKPFGHAWQMELSKRIIRKLPEVQQFRQFLIREDTQGNITRQETVSMTRWTRRVGFRLMMLCGRQLSKIQASPAFMCTLRPWHRNSTPGCVTIGTCTRTRWAQ